MPPKKKKNGSKNAFYFYMEEFRAKKEAEGVVFPGGLKDVADAASPSWKGLDPKSKRVYENMAERAKVAGNGGVRYTTQGQTFDDVDREKKEAEERKRIMLRTIQNEVEAGGRMGLKSHRFYFIHVNHYGIMEDKRFIPCEVAVLAYSIDTGFLVENMYHEFIANMELPNGYAFRAKSHTQATHKCPLPPKAMGSPDHPKIYEEILTLMEKNGDLDEGRPPPVYTLTQFIPEVEDFFSKCSDFLHSDFQVTRIYPLEELFFRMKNFGLKPEGQHLFFNGIEDSGFKYNANASDILKGDIYDYSSGIACQFHEDLDVRQHCSKSYVIRWSYLLSDHLCANLDVKIVSERHTPRGTDLYAIKITSQMDQLRLRDAAMEAPRESCGRGKPVEGRSVPTSRTVHAPMARGGPWPSNASSDSRCSSRSSSRGQNDRPLTIVDHSKFLVDDDDDFVPPASVSGPTPENAPLRAPKSKGKSSVLLGLGALKESPGPSGNENLLLGGVGRGRGTPKNMFQL